MQADDHRHGQAAPIQQGFRRRPGKGRADDHALGHIVQGDGRRHHQSCHKQAAAGLTALPVLLQVVGVSQLLQGIRRFGVVLVNMGHLVVGSVVNPGVQHRNHDIADKNTRNHQPHVIAQIVRVQGLGQQVEAHHAGHDPRRKGQQQADGFAGILTEQAGQQPPHSRAAHTRQGGDANHTPDHFSMASLC